MSELLPNRWTTRNKCIPRHVIAKVEQSWQIQFPAEYVALAMEFDGGHPEQDAVMLPEGEVCYFAQLASYEEDSGYHIVRHWSGFFERLPVRVFPFAEDGGGNPFAFDYRESSSAPSVWWYDHEPTDEDGMSPGVQVAWNFAEFLTLLRPDTIATDVRI